MKEKKPTINRAKRKEEPARKRNKKKKLKWQKFLSYDKKSSLPKKI